MLCINISISWLLYKISATQYYTIKDQMAVQYTVSYICSDIKDILLFY